MKELKILVGCSASGKSTWSKEFVAKHDKWCIVSRDDYRYAWQNKGTVDPKLESIITEKVLDSIETLINNGYNVIYDATNLKAEYIAKVTSVVKHTAKVTYQIFDIPIEVAIERDSKRERKVGQQVIEKQYKDYLVLLGSFSFQPILPTPHRYVEPTFEVGKRNAIIVDIDGTLAHSSGKRGWYEYDKVHTDDVDAVVRYVINNLKGVFDVLIVSGREDNCKDITLEWLNKYRIEFTDIFMRKTGDGRKDSIIKEEIFWNDIYPNYNVVCVFDDRNSVVKMWRNLGIKTFQCDYGNF